MRDGMSVVEAAELMGYLPPWSRPREWPHEPFVTLHPICPVCDSQRIGELYDADAVDVTFDGGESWSERPLSYTCQACGFGWSHEEHTNYSEAFAARIKAARRDRDV